MRFLLPLLLALCVGQEKPASFWIEKLRSETMADREEAVRNLVALGKTALPDLEKAAADQDEEVRTRVRWLLERIRLEDLIPPSLKKAMPGVSGRLASGEWTSVFLEVLKLDDSGHPRKTGLTPDVPAFLGPRAVKGAAGSDQRINMAVAVKCHRIREAAPALCDYLEDDSPEVRNAASRAIREFRPRNVLADLARLLSSKKAETRRTVLDLLDGLDLRGAIPAALPLLADPDPVIRETAVRTLTQFEARESLVALRACRADTAPGVRAAAARAMGSLGSTADLDSLHRILQDPDINGRIAAMHAMNTLGDPNLVKELVAILPGSDESVRLYAAILLADRGSKESIQPILDYLLGEGFEGAVNQELYCPFQGDPELERQAARALGTSLRSTDAVVRERAVDIAGRLGLRSASAEVTRRLADSSGEVRAAAVEALGRLGVRDALSKIAGLLGDKEHRVHLNATKAIGELEGTKYIPDLVTQLGSESEEIRIEAIYSLSMLKAREALPELRKLATHEGPMVRAMVLSALENISGTEDGLLVVKALADPDPTVVARAGWVLQLMGPGDHLKPLRKLLAGGPNEVRLKVIEVLQSLKDQASGADLIALLKDPDPTIRREAILALGYLEVRDAIPHLLSFQDDPRSEVADAARSALALLDAREALPAFLKLTADGLTDDTGILKALSHWRAPGIVATLRAHLVHPYGTVRAMALRQLGELKSREAGDDILARLEDEVWEVRAAAAKALVAIGFDKDADLKRILESEDPDIRKRALATVAALHRESSTAMILPLLKDPMCEVRARAASSLARLKATEHIAKVSMLLSDPSPDTIAAACTALGTLEAHDEAPRLVKLLEDGRRPVREASAAALCWLGNSKGVEHLFSWDRLGEGANRFALNGLRSPEMVRKLRAISIEDHDRSGTKEELWSEWGREAGVAVALPKHELLRETSYGIPGFGGKASALEILDRLQLDGNFDIILEKDLVRFLPRAEALEFWKSWWATAPK